MPEAVEDAQLDVHAGPGETVGDQLGVAEEDVVAARVDEGRRQPVEVGEQRRRAWIVGRRPVEVEAGAFRQPRARKDRLASRRSIACSRRSASGPARARSGRAPPAEDRRSRAPARPQRSRARCPPSRRRGRPAPGRRRARAAMRTRPGCPRAPSEGDAPAPGGSRARRRSRPRRGRGERRSPPRRAPSRSRSRRRGDR